MKHVYLANFCIVGVHPSFFERYVFPGISEIPDEHKNLVIQLESPVLTDKDLLQILEQGKQALAKKSTLDNIEPEYEHPVELRALNYLGQHHVG